MSLFNPSNTEGWQPIDTIVITPGGIHLHLDPDGIIKEATGAGKLEELKRHLESTVLPKMNEYVRAKTRELGLDLNSLGFDALPPEVQEEFHLMLLKSYDDFGRQNLILNLPGVPIVRGVSEVMNLGNPEWPYPYYKAHLSGVADITFLFDGPPDQTLTAAALWSELAKFSPETADVLEILLAHLAASGTPRGIVRITPREIAEYRGRKHRGGSTRKLLEDLKQEVIRIASISLTMKWKDKRKGEVLTFGKPVPDRLLNIVGWELERDGKTWTAFTYQCGQALAHFVGWYGRGHLALVRMNPRTHALEKKVGRFLINIGVGAAWKGYQPRFGIGTLLDFCGERPNFKHPGRTVERLARSFDNLWDAGVLMDIPNVEAVYKHKCRGNLQAWLKEVVTARLSPNIAKIDETARVKHERPPILADQNG